MSFELRWLDEESRILKVRLFSLDQETVMALYQQLSPIVEESTPLFLLVDLGDLDFRDFFRQPPEDLPEDMSLANLGFHERHSAVAIVTTNPLVKMALETANRLAGRADVIRTFQYEDEALTWLQGRATSA